MVNFGFMWLVGWMVGCDWHGLMDCDWIVFGIDWIAGLNE